MKVYFSIGSALAVVSVISGFVMGDWGLVFKISGIAFLVPALFAGVLTGAFVSGDRNRANFYTETKEDRETKHNWTKNLVALALPNFMVVIILILFSMSMV